MLPHSQHPGTPAAPAFAETAAEGVVAQFSFSDSRIAPVLDKLLPKLDPNRLFDQLLLENRKSGSEETAADTQQRAKHLTSLQDDKRACVHSVLSGTLPLSRRNIALATPRLTSPAIEELLLTTLVQPRDSS